MLANKIQLQCNPKIALRFTNTSVRPVSNFIELDVVSQLRVRPSSSPKHIQSIRVLSKQLVSLTEETSENAEDDTKLLLITLVGRLQQQQWFFTLKEGTSDGACDFLLLL